MVEQAALIRRIETNRYSKMLVSTPYLRSVQVYDLEDHPVYSTSAIEKEKE